MANVLSDKEVTLIDAYWRAANYLSIGQIYLYDNPLLKKSLTKEHIKPRLLGHWGTTPGLNFIYVHLNRLIKKHDLNMLYLTGPGHGGPGLVANAYLEGTYSEVYPNISQDEAGMKRLFTQFSFPGGIPSHVAPETPGSIHEGGELGYALSHAYGAAFDNPDLIVAAVVEPDPWGGHLGECEVGRVRRPAGRRGLRRTDIPFALALGFGHGIPSFCSAVIHGKLLPWRNGFPYLGLTSTRSVILGACAVSTVRRAFLTQP